VVQTPVKGTRLRDSQVEIGDECQGITGSVARIHEASSSVPSYRSKGTIQKFALMATSITLESTPRRSELRLVIHIDRRRGGWTQRVIASRGGGFQHG